MKPFNTRLWTAALLAGVLFSGREMLLAQSTETLYDYAKALSGLNERNLYETTVAVLEEYLNRYPEGENAHEIQFLLGNVHEEQKNKDFAYLSFLKVTVLYPKSPKVPDARAMAKLDVANEKKMLPIKEKLQSLLEAGATGDAFADRFYNMLGQVRDLLYPDLNEALLSECRQFLKTFPDHAGAPAVQEWMGDMHQENKKYWEALAAYLGLVHLYPKSDKVLSSQVKIGDLYGENLKRPDLAVAQFETVVKSTSDAELAARAQWKIADVLDNKVKDYARAAQEFQILVDKFPSSPDAVQALMRRADIMVNKLKQYEDGIRTYEDVVTKFPAQDQAVEAMMLTAGVYEDKMKDYEKAIQAKISFVDKFPEHARAAETLYEAGDLAERRVKNIDQAVEIYSRIVEKYPADKVKEKAQRRIELLKKG